LTETLAGQVVWITGCSSGIGEYLAYELAKAGCTLILSARRIDELQRVKKQCLRKQLHSSLSIHVNVVILTVFGPISDEDVLVAPLDVTDTESHETAVEGILSKFGHVSSLNQFLIYLALYCYFASSSFV
jgi:dehydrogenase/reductase SDR family protein 7